MGTLIYGPNYTYKIEKVLGQGAFGITYLVSTFMEGPLGKVNVQLALKEFFAKDLDSRKDDGTVSMRTESGVAYKYARAFRRESEQLSKMNHPGIVNVLEAFEANGTYYYSMEYLPGGSLDDKVRGGGLPEDDSLSLIAKIGEALSYMHERKMMHLDIKPKNIMLKGDGSPVIIDFGLSKQYGDDGEPESSSTIGWGTPGFAPVEQANQTSGHLFQPTLDIYALGATLYKMLIGSTPPPASEILNEGFPEDMLRMKSISTNTIDAIQKAMSVARKNRPQSVREFLAVLGVNATIGNKEELNDDETTILSFEPEIKVQPDSGLEPLSSHKTKNYAPLLFLPLGIVLVVSLLVFMLGGREETYIVPESEQKGTTSIPQVPSVLISGITNGYEWVDLALPSGTKWATVNVGAASPSDFGSYFAWGELKQKREYSVRNYRYNMNENSSTELSLSKYNTNEKSGPVDNKTYLESIDDVAYVNWGGGWRTPSNEELRELIQHCTWTWSTIDDKEGFIVSSRTNSNSIFLPAAGYNYGTSRLEGGGCYWSSTLSYNPTFALNLYFTPEGKPTTTTTSRCYGLTIRPVI